MKENKTMWFRQKTATFSAEHPEAECFYYVVVQNGGEEQTLACDQNVLHALDTTIRAALQSFPKGRITNVGTVG